MTFDLAFAGKYLVIGLLTLALVQMARERFGRPGVGWRDVVRYGVLWPSTLPLLLLAFFRGQLIDAYRWLAR